MGDTTSPPSNLPGHANIVGIHDVVNPANGSLSVSIPVAVPGGRLQSIPFSIFYSSAGTTFLENDAPGSIVVASQSAAYQQNGWSFSFPLLTYTESDYDPDGFGGACKVATNYMFQDPDGQRHALGLSNTGWDYGYDGALCSDTFYVNSQAGEGPLLAVTQPVPTTDDDSYQEEPVAVTEPDGTLYYYITAGSQPAWGVMPQYIEDRNGNYITVSGGTVNHPGVTYTDTLGRTVLQTSGFGSGTDTITAGVATYSVTWGTISSGYNISYNITDTPNGSCGVGTAAGVNGPVITSVTTPDGTYQFQYDPTYGLLSKIIYPNGGYVQYVWGQNPDSEAGQFVANNGNQGWVFWQDQPECLLQYSTPVITERIVNDGTANVEEQQFGYSTSGWGTGPSSLYWTTKQTTITTTDEVTGATYVTTDTFTPVSISPQPDTIFDITGQMPLESQVAQAGSGGTLQVVNETWNGNPPFLPITQQSMTCDTAGGCGSGGNFRANMVSICYDSFEEPKETDVYDYGAPAPQSSATYGALLRKTTTDFEDFYDNQTEYNGFENQPANLFDLPTSVIVKDGNGNVLSETKYGYDETAVSAVSATQHDDLDYPAGNVGNAYGNTPRGNLTTKSTWTNTSGAALTSTIAYDQTGQVVSVLDPNNNLTTYSYADNFNGGGGPGNTNAYLTSVTDPLGLVNSYSWFYTGGQMATHTDANGQTTQYAYSDPWGRLTQVTEPGIQNPNGTSVTPQTSYSYTTSTLETQSVTLSGQPSTDSVVTYDGLGRVSTEATKNGSGTYDRAETCYDGIGRVHERTYPTQSSNGGGTGNCSAAGDTYLYDALNRIVSISHSDGTAIIYTYAGLATKEQDEGNGSVLVTHIRQLDGLGNAASVCEVITSDSGGESTPSDCNTQLAGLSSGGASAQPLDIDATGFATAYFHDVTGNLLATEQPATGGTLTRQFNYDLASRLTSASNPESGTISYVYDSDSTCPSYNGELVRRTDARGISTCYSYDADHDVTGKSYSDGTPAASYTYGTSGSAQLAGFGLANVAGRLDEASAGGSYEVFSYNADGGVALDAECTPQGCPAGGGGGGGGSTPTKFGSPQSVEYDYQDDPPASSLTVNLPNGGSQVNADTIYIAQVVTRNGAGSSNPGVSAPSGFSQVCSVNGGEYNLAQTFYAIYPAGSTPPATATFTSLNNSLGAGGVIAVAYQGVNSTTPFDGACQSEGAGAGSTSVTAPSLTTTLANDLALWNFYVMGDVGTTTPTITEGTTELCITRSEFNAEGYMRYADMSMPSAGATGENTLTWYPNQDQYNTGAGAMVMALISAGSGPSGTWFQNNYSYDGIGDLIENQLPGYFDVANTFDQAGREVTSASGGTSYLSAGVYNAFGELTSANMGPSLSESRSYDTRGRLTGIARADYTLSAISYAPDGQILALNDTANGGAWSYTYDDLNRLRSATNSSDQAGYSYDREGNRWGESLNFTPTCGVDSICPPPSSLTFNNTSNRIDGASYDASGDLLAAGGATFTYDAEGRISTAISNGVTTQYSYDAEGRRVMASVGGVVTQSVYNAGASRPVLLDGNNNLIRAELADQGRAIATMANGNVYADVGDQVGTARARTVYTQTTASETYTSGPFGELLNQVGAIDRAHFTGQDHDPETGLDYFGARYYNSDLGRFMTPDWSDADDPVPNADLSDPQTLNLYAYAGNDPVSDLDPDGHLGLPQWLQHLKGGVIQWALPGRHQKGPAPKQPSLPPCRVNQEPPCFTATATAYKNAPDPSIGMDIFHDSPDCSGCGQMWRNDDALGNGLTGALLAMAGGEFGALAEGGAAEGAETTDEGPEASGELFTTPAGRPYSWHYLTETGPGRNIPGSVVDETIDNATEVNNLGDRSTYYDAKNDVTVVRSNTTGKIISAHRGRP